MQICFPGQKPNLTAWENRPIDARAGGPPLPNAHFDHHSRIVGVEPPGAPVPGGPFERAAAAVMSYRAFPERVAYGVVNRTPVQLGDTVGLCYHLIPGVRVFFASRVVQVINTEAPIYQRGFRYQTLHWHPEIGAETLCAEKVAETGAVRVYLDAWSLPAPWMRIWTPVARAIQLAAGRDALDHLERIAQNA
jgi:uncharacterized protein (UPF0548 family)